MAQFAAPTEGIAITDFIVSRDVERSRRFYVEVLGGEAVLEGALSIVALANGWITISVGGGPTDDKPTVTLEAPSDSFVMTSGVGVPFDDDLLEKVVDSAPLLVRKSPAEAIEDRRFAEAVYRAAITDRVMRGVTYQDPSDVGDAA